MTSVLDLVGQPLPVTAVTWTPHDTALYALGVGAGATDPTRELELTTENTRGLSHQVLPGFGLVLAHRAGYGRHLGQTGASTALHADQAVRWTRPLPSAGCGTATPRITAVHDKGSGALVVFETTVADADGAPYLTSTSGVFLKGVGGWGGDRGPDPAEPVPASAPDRELTMVLRPDQALLYRLSGDTNPLHSDPAVARAAGFPVPILHGLCTFGIAARLIANDLCCDSSDVVRHERLVAMSGRFSRPVLPGSTLTVRVWQVDDSTVRFDVRADADIAVQRGTLVIGCAQS